MPIHKDIGIVLRSYDYRTSSKIAVFYTLHYGKLTGIFKAFKVKKDKFMTSLDLFTLNQFVFYDKKSALWLVTESYLIDSFEHIKKDLNAFFCASYAIAFIDAVMAFQQKNRDIFHLATTFFQNLVRVPAPLLLSIFQLKMLVCLGWYPSLVQCVRCGVEVTEQAALSIERGGLLCPRCKTTQHGYQMLRQETVLVLRYILKYNFPQVLRIAVSGRALREMRLMLDNFIEYHVHPGLKAERFVP